MKSSVVGPDAVGVVAVLALATFANTLSCGFVWDDRAAILTNRDLRADETSVWDLFAHDFWGTSLASRSSHKSFRPLTVLSFRLNHALGGFHPFGYHLVNVLLHVASSALVVLCGRRLLATSDLPRAPVIAGALFAVHPVHCDSVASVVGRADVLCTFLALVAYLAYDTATTSSTTSWPLYTLSLALVVAATLCKELGATTLGIFVALEIARIVAQPSKDSWYRDPITRACGLRAMLLVVGGSAAITGRIALNGPDRLYVWTVMENDISLLPWGAPRLLTTLHTHAWYLWKLLWPQHLCYDYGFRTLPVVESWRDGRNLLTLAAYVFMVLLLYLCWRQRRSSPLWQLVAFGVFPFVPAANVLFPVGTIVAERLLYFPSVGFCLVLGYVADGAIASAPCRLQVLLQGALVLLVSAGIYRSITRNAEWATEDTLFEASVAVAPWSVKVLSNLSKTLLGSDPQRAAAYLERAVGEVPDYAVGHLNLGLAYVGMSKPLHGIQNLLRAVEIDASVAAYAYLGRYAMEFYMQQQYRRFPRANETHAAVTAKKVMDHTLALGCSMPGLHFARGIFAFYADDYPKAIEQFQSAVDANSRVQARGYDLEEMADSPKRPSSFIYPFMRCVACAAIADGENTLTPENMRVVKNGPHCMEILNNAALRLTDRGLVQEAIELYARAIHAFPRSTALLVNAARLAEDTGNDVEAYSLYSRAFELDPTQEQLQANFALLQQRLSLPLAAAVPPQPMAA
ncbi:transmembrane and TPR repeat-containing protein 4 isoform X2 [Achlya hypogyna]|uniref:dolichyl-phosphate-mannose--protein mannosyltransferase n=1 Tax=Achlya hypogyna TaxID=1202772 RepID=A0A1V9ZDF0_ACHHY|nr:transmembrane and TPR repeat-containing protein 4 isoform X2 [Achlya hypogyna]